MSEKVKNAELIIETIPFAKKLARQFYKDRQHFDIDYDDFEGAALLGLCDAARRFDPERGMLFKTFSYFRIRGAMYDLMRRGGGLPRQYFKQLVKHAEERDVQGEEIEDEKIAGEIKACAKEKELPYSFARNYGELAGLAAIIAHVGIELHYNVEGGPFELSYLEQLDPEKIVAIRNSLEHLQKLITKLTDKESRMLTLRYFRGYAFEQMKDDFPNVSKSSLSRLHAKAIKNLRQQAKLSIDDCRERVETYV